MNTKIRKIEVIIRLANTYYDEAYKVRMRQMWLEVNGKTVGTTMVLGSNAIREVRLIVQFYKNSRTPFKLARTTSGSEWNKQETKNEDVLDLTKYAADIIEIGYEQQECGGETDFDKALRIFCERQKKTSTLIKVERAEKQFNAEFKGEGETFAFDV